MNTKSTVLLALLLPGMAMLAACNPDTATEADNAAITAPGDMAEAPATDAMPPADPMTPPPVMSGDEMSFADMDKNQDGGITQDELTAADMLHQHFSVADANADGMLSEEEVAQHRADMAASPAN